MNLWKVILATMVIFGSGVVTGALIGRLDHQRVKVVNPAGPRQPNAKNIPAQPWQLQRTDFLRRMEKQLDLTTNQQDHIEKIMHASQERTKPIWDQIAPQMRDELNKTHEEIRKELNTAQLKKFEELLRKNPHKGENGNLSSEEHRHRQMLKGSNQVPAQPKP